MIRFSQVRRAAEKVGGHLEEDTVSGGERKVWQVVSPRGQLWVSGHTVHLRVEWIRGDKEHRQSALQDALDRIKCGLEGIIEAKEGSIQEMVRDEILMTRNRIWWRLKRDFGIDLEKERLAGSYEVEDTVCSKAKRELSRQIKKSRLWTPWCDRKMWPSGEEIRDVDRTMKL